jgi:ParB-like chromosome segregation protein Spo0J
MTTTAPTTEIQTWPIDSFVPYARNPRKNDAVVDRMCGSIREFGFKIPILARSNSMSAARYPARLTRPGNFLEN